MENFTKEQKATIRAIVLAHYSERGGRNVRIMSNGGVSVTVDKEYGSIRYYRNPKAIFAGYATDILRTGHC